jgi:hypothetical protein
MDKHLYILTQLLIYEFKRRGWEKEIYHIEDQDETGKLFIIINIYKYLK